MLHAFPLLFSYQVVQALREAFMLAKFLAETRSYAVAVTALVLMLLVPLTGSCGVASTVQGCCRP